MAAYFLHDKLFELCTKSSLDVDGVHAHCYFQRVRALFLDRLADLVLLFVIRLTHYRIGALGCNAYLVEPLTVISVELRLCHLLLVQDLSQHLVDLASYLQPGRRDSAGATRHLPGGSVCYGDNIRASIPGSCFLPRIAGLFPSLSSGSALSSGGPSESLLDKLVTSCRFSRVSS